MKNTKLILSSLAVLSLIITGCIRRSGSDSQRQSKDDSSSESSSNANHDPSTRFAQDFNTKQEAFENGNNVTKDICEEGMILLKNRDGALPLIGNKPKVSVFGKNSVN